MLALRHQKHLEVVEGVHRVEEVEGVLFEHLQAGEEVDIIQGEMVLVLHNEQ